MWKKLPSIIFSSWIVLIFFQSPDDLFQNLFLEMKKLEIEETKVTYFVSVLKLCSRGYF